MSYNLTIKGYTIRMVQADTVQTRHNNNLYLLRVRFQQRIAHVAQSQKGVALPEDQMDISVDIRRVKS